MTDDSSLLLTLEEVSRLVSHCHDPAETLTNIVHLIQDRFHTAVCSVYLLEAQRGELVLSATVGLKPEGIGRLRMRLDEGLTGLVAQQMKPVMVADAFQDPRFKYFPDSGEDRYHSFLGVPLVESGSLQGVLVVQTVEPHTFRPGEVRMLVTVAAQLASLVADAQLLEQIAVATHAEPTAPSAIPLATAPLQGVALSPGKGYGQAYIVDGLDQWRSSVALISHNEEYEQQRLAAAIEQAREELTRLSQRVSALVGEEHGAILQAQLLITQDRNLITDLHQCLHQGASAEGALIATLDKYVAAFHKLTSSFFQERVFDVKDVFYRILWQLRPRDSRDSMASRVVVVAREASVMDLFTVDLDRLAGVVVEFGGPQSHAAILARCLNVPMISQVHDFALLHVPGQPLLVDAGSQGTGVVIIDPSPEQIPVWPVAALTPGPKLAEQTSPPGVPRTEVNINLLVEVDQALKIGISGVGLYRSEFLFLARRTLPTEEQQYNVYRKLVLQLAGRPVTIRTFDLRPDKLASYSNLGTITSRPLDWRLVLESPPLQELFLEQVRAIFRAATLGPARILVPLVTRSEVLDFVVETVKQARQGLARDGLDFAPDVPLGVMIEVDAAVPLVGEWTEQVAFFALGTNDLSASALGIERDDPLAATQVDSLHPGILCLIEDVVSVAHPRGKPVSVCGEMAADPIGAIALAALQIDSLSVPVNQYLSVQKILAGLSAENLSRLKPHLLRQRTAADIRAVVREWVDKNSTS
jgi:phosphotransferase system enzyme I (PtsP)